MDIKDLFRNVESTSRVGGTRSYILLESLVTKLLARHVEEQGKTYVSNVRLGQREIDGLVLEGFEDLPGPTLIEIKLLRSKRQLGTLRETFERLYSVTPFYNFNSILFVAGNTLTRIERDQIQKIAGDLAIDVPLKIYDLDDLSNLSKQYPESISSIIPAFTALAVNHVVAKSVESDPLGWEKAREQHIKQLKAAHSRNDLVLLLGAGVSLTAGMPDWNSLLTKLLVIMIGEKLPHNLDITNEEKQIIADNLRTSQGSSPLLEARYIRAGLGDAFDKTVSKLLYAGIGKDNRGTSKLLEALAKLCIPKRSGPGIRAVLTYNFDDLFERHLEQLGVQYRAIYRDVDIASQEELGIYHVHGFLPQNIEPYDGVSESLLIFSEERYHILFLDPYSWANIVQVNFFRESTCLLVGVSVTDPNLRRLLDIAAQKNKNPKHYVILKRLLPSEFLEASQDGTEPIRSEAVRAFISAHHQLQETSFQELGLNIIWVEDYEEIPTILDSLRR